MTDFVEKTYCKYCTRASNMCLEPNSMKCQVARQTVLGFITRYETPSNKAPKAVRLWLYKKRVEMHDETPEDFYGASRAKNTNKQTNTEG